MKTSLACLICVLAVVFTSCKKNDDGGNPDNANKISSHNPAELSAAIKVFHGTRTIGITPASTSNTPAVEGPETVYAIAGRYAIIKPELISGEIEGYYVSIPGAGQYFKVDFTKPRNIGGRKHPTKQHEVSLRPLSGNADSSIVIELPPNIKVPDTICVTYLPYDLQGSIGQPVTTCIIVNSLGGDANSAWLQNEWRETATWYLVNNQRQFFDTIIYNQWRPLIEYDSYDGYECVTDPNTGISQLDHAPRGSSTLSVKDSAYIRKGNIKFSVNGAYGADNDEDNKYVNFPASTCSDILYYPVETYKSLVPGVWNFNSSTNKLIIVFEFDEDGNPNPESWEYDIIKIDDNHLIFREPINNYYSRFER